MIDEARMFERDRETGMMAKVGRHARRRPLDSFAMVLAAIAAVAIVTNALGLQNGAHPAPLYGAAPRGPAAEEAARTRHGAEQRANPLIGDIQEELQRRGIYDGAVDGVPGERTHAAIRSFQIAAGLRPTGEATEELLAALMTSNGSAGGVGEDDGASADVAPKPRPAPAADVAGMSVIDVQSALNRKGFGPLVTDGLMGNATRDAIRRFEQSRGIAPRGEITPEIVRLLRR